MTFTNGILSENEFITSLNLYVTLFAKTGLKEISVNVRFPRVVNEV